MIFLINKCKIFLSDIGFQLDFFVKAGRNIRLKEVRSYAADVIDALNRVVDSNTNYSLSAIMEN